MIALLKRLSLVEVQFAKKRQKNNLTEPPYSFQAKTLNINICAEFSL
jgi:hypothetical protein